MAVPKSHPRYASLNVRDTIVDGVLKGITSLHGLTAHGRGEAFDYLIGEKTNKFAKTAIRAAAIQLLLAKHPVISVNGNVTALVVKELIQLANLLSAPLEVNLFHASKKREIAIRDHLLKYGAKNVLMPSKNHTISHLDSNRKYVNKDGIYIADVVFVPLEDGDRTEALIKNGKKVITVDLNPLSRTAQKATITIVDNIIRVMPLLIEEIKKSKIDGGQSVEKILSDYDNDLVLKEAEKYIRTKRE
jgi:4-phosphopantoate--beta-alanine ligase